MSSAGFEKVIKRVDEMVAILGKEQADEDDKKECCGSNSWQTTARQHSNAQLLAKRAIATAKETIATLTQEIAALTAGIKALDKSVTEATSQRQDENAEYKALIASDTAATHVLEFAKIA